MTPIASPRNDEPRGGAVALSHADAGKAPVVVAKGYGVVAESIVREAKANGLFVHSSPELVSLLMQVDLDREIPPQLYRAVAEVMAWLHELEAKAP
ncbi:EscU/YscU/HrcU family type III secretion system export apparatus switch protein [Variovorax dokdonensis]|uniref:EscU/YscU/HrcU family type III secretion system export apparatus switch protein n=1 Tax=Variovorax dokdonensis TaxID=344883 RepID=A0ABT7N4V5_9BURK|nr:EscU/YscU/HrcU family type III secretion system export apparatus switch protein [Variovorax dokdonensis]MDM0042974.1 EscU/YscU/HrcU family type III secretion system export apparatus switch protein [Variovorax dokdonensis]